MDYVPNLLVAAIIVDGKRTRSIEGGNEIDEHLPETICPIILPCKYFFSSPVTPASQHTMYREYSSPLREAAGEHAVGR